MTTAGVKVSEILDAARRRRALLAPEIAGYLVLGAADQLARAPTRLDEEHCGLLVEGGRVVVAPSPPSSPQEAERALRDLLRRLLEAATGRAPALNGVASGTVKGDVARFVAELESALIPVNRAAAGRALSRLARDAVRARVADAPAPSPAAEAAMSPPAIEPPADDTEPIPVAQLPAFELVDDAAPNPAEATSDVDELLAHRLSANPPPVEEAAPAPRPSHPSSSRGVDELIDGFMSSTSRKESRVAGDLRRMAGVETPLAPKTTASGATETPPLESPFDNASGRPDFYTATPPPRPAQSVLPPPPEEDPLSRRSTRRNVYVLFAILAVLTLGTVALLRLEPGFLSGRTADVVEEEQRSAAAAAASIAARAAGGACRATLVVTDVPAGAEVLVRSGIAPVDVERVPTGARLEFVALADGFAPRRGVVPQGAPWDSINGKPRFELPIQLEKSRAKPGLLDAWPSTEPGTVVGGQGPPGTVHVVTSPRGAEVWLVAGGAPEAKLESLPCGAGLDLLIAGGQGQPLRRKLRVDAAQLTPDTSGNAVTSHVSAKP